MINPTKYLKKIWILWSSRCVSPHCNYCNFKMIQLNIWMGKKGNKILLCDAPFTDNLHIQLWFQKRSLCHFSPEKTCVRQFNMSISLFNASDLKGWNQRLKMGEAMCGGNIANYAPLFYIIRLMLLSSRFANAYVDKTIWIRSSYIRPDCAYNDGNRWK